MGGWHLNEQESNRSSWAISHWSLSVSHKYQRKKTWKWKKDHSEEMVQWKHEAKKSKGKFKKPSWNILLRTDRYLSESFGPPKPLTKHLLQFLIYRSATAKYEDRAANKQWTWNYLLGNQTLISMIRHQTCNYTVPYSAKTLKVDSYCCTLMIWNPL